MTQIDLDKIKDEFFDFAKSNVTMSVDLKNKIFCLFKEFETLQRGKELDGNFDVLQHLRDGGKVKSRSHAMTMSIANKTDLMLRCSEMWHLIYADDWQPCKEPFEQLADGDKVEVIRDGLSLGQQGVVVDAAPNEDGKICVAFKSPWIGWFKPDELKRVKEK